MEKEPDNFVDKSADETETLSKIETFLKNHKPLVFASILSMSYAAHVEEAKADMMADAMPQGVVFSSPDFFLGKGLSEKARNLGFKVSVDVEQSGAKRTILHIGQTHDLSIPKADYTPEERQRITTRQKQVFELLKDYVGGEVFIESVLDDQKTQGGISRFHSYNASLLNANNFEDFKRSYDSYVNDKELSLHFLVALNYTASRKLTELGFTEMSPSVFINGDIVVRMVDFAGNMSLADSNNQEEISVSLFGAVSASSINRGIHIKPAENTDTYNEMSQKMDDTANKLIELYTTTGATYGFSEYVSSYDFYVSVQRDLLPKILSMPEKLDKEALDKLVASWNDLKTFIFTKRESDAVSNIGKYSSPDSTVTPLVFGEAHNFSDAVKNWNRNNPNNQFNLVSFK